MTSPDTLISRIGARGLDLTDRDFLLTWDLSRGEVENVLDTALALKALRSSGADTRIFNTGLAVSIFRDHSTRTRYSFAAATNLMGLGLMDLDETKSQIAHGETVRETANMLSFLTQVIGIRDDMYLGAGHTYMKEVSAAVRQGASDGVLDRAPTVINLQCDVDHPTQSLADLAHLSTHFGGLENLRGKKIAMTWAYSPSYGKPLSVPQGIIGLMTRFGMDVRLAHPDGYGLIPEVEAIAAQQASDSGGVFRRCDSMAEAFDGADIVYPKSWAPFAVMGERTELLRAGDRPGLDALEGRALAQNAQHMDWTCDEAMMARTAGGEALYMHCLPADITGVSCEHGEVSAAVFEKYRTQTYIEAGYKPYIIAAMMLLGRSAFAVDTLRKLERT
jgi:knotted carbamoyltransferase YgeW